MKKLERSDVKFKPEAALELERIANAIEEILRLVKKDMEPKKK